jgi:hypothetical protein
MAYYIEQKSKILSNVIKQTEHVLIELANRLKRFESISNLSEEERVQLIATLSEDPCRKLEDEFIMRGLVYGCEKDIETLRKDTKFKLNLRNILGVKHSEDWIYNLNIGNVMHLAGMTLDELCYPEELTHELHKDAMLEKIILVCTAYFCLGTEF